MAKIWILAQWVGGGGGGRNVKTLLRYMLVSFLGNAFFFLPLVYSIQGQKSFRPKIPTVCNLETFKMSRDISFTIMWHVWPANAQISLRHTRCLMISERRLCWSLVRFCPLCSSDYVSYYFLCRETSSSCAYNSKIILTKVWQSRHKSVWCKATPPPPPPPHWKGLCP